MAGKSTEPTPTAPTRKPPPRPTTTAPTTTAPSTAPPTPSLRDRVKGFRIVMLEPPSTTPVSGVKRWTDAELGDVLWVLDRLGGDRDAVGGVTLKRVEKISSDDSKSKGTPSAKWRSAGQWIAKGRIIEIADTGTTRRDFAHECGHAVANHGHHLAVVEVNERAEALRAVNAKVKEADAAYLAAHAAYTEAVDAENAASSAIDKPSTKSKTVLQAEHAACVKTTEDRLAERERLGAVRADLVNEAKAAEAAHRAATQLYERSYSKVAGTSARVVKFQTDVVQKRLEDPHTEYARAEWPDKPEEYYAEAFADWITGTTGFATTCPKVYAYFNTGRHRKE